jgi:hypothetical protein
VLNVTDLFDSQTMETVTETARLRELSLRRLNGRTVFAGLSYRFGSFGRLLSACRRRRRLASDQMAERRFDIF